MPAKIIRYRFDDNIIKELLEVNYSKLSIEVITRIRGMLEEPITVDNVSRIVNAINKSNE